MSTLRDWNFYDRPVQSGISVGQQISSESVLLCAGPPFLQSTAGSVQASEFGPGLPSDTPHAAGSEIVWNIGMVSSVGISQAAQQVPVPEIGSSRRYYVSGPSDGSLSLQRPLIHGPNLLRALFAYRGVNNPNSRGGVIPSLIDNADPTFVGYPKNYLFDNPGNGNLWSNLGSDIFRQGFGLLVYIEDAGREAYGAFYLEQCYIGQHNFQVAAGQLVTAEAVSATFGRVRPVKLSRQVPLIGLSRNAGSVALAGGEYTMPISDPNGAYLPFPDSMNQ